MQHADCPFCNTDRELTASSAHALAFPDHYPVSKGHTLVVPRRHVASYFELTQAEQHDLWDLVTIVRNQLMEQYRPDGLNIGINDGAAAGQTVFHAHIHLIPRYLGDVSRPRGGVRGVLPGKKEYG